MFILSGILLLGWSVGLSQDTLPILKTDTIQEVVVTAEKIRYDAEGYRIYIANYPLLQKMNLSSMLRFLPGMVMNGPEMEVYGKRVGQLYVNNRRIRLSGSALRQYLSTFEGQSIRSIKVVETAGAEVSATEGGSAILKIYTKRLEDGGNMSLSTNGEWRPYYQSEGASVNLQQRAGRWSVTSVGNYTHVDVDLSREIERYDNDIEVALTEGTRMMIQRNNPRVDIDVAYDISSNDYLSVDIVCSSEHANGDDLFDVIRKQQGNIEQYTGRSRFHTKKNDHTLSAQYVHEWKTGSLSLSSFYLNAHNIDKQSMWREVPDRNNSYENKNDNSTRLITFNADYNTQLPGTLGSVKAGCAHASWRNGDDMEEELLLDVTDGQESAYRYLENTTAAYLSWNWRKKAFTSSLGLRFEHRDLNPHQLEDGDNRSTYDNLFPNLRLNYALSQKMGHSLRLSVSRKCLMPQVVQMNPYRRWSDEYTCSTGNPFLHPEFATMIDAHLTLWRNYSFVGTYRYGGRQQSVTFRNDQNGALVHTYDNGAREHGWKLTATAMTMLGKKGILNINATQNLLRYHYNEEYVRDNSFSVSATIAYSLPRDFRMQGYVNYTSPQRTVYSRTNKRIGLSCGISRSFLKDRLNMSLSYTYFSPVRQDYLLASVQSSSQDNFTFHSINFNASYSLKWGSQHVRIRTNTSKSEERNRL